MLRDSVTERVVETITINGKVAASVVEVISAIGVITPLIDVARQPHASQTTAGHAN